jgi:hypothetical protein
MIRKTLLIPALVVTVIGSSLWATTQTFAQDTNPQTSLVQKIADKFNLNKNDVQKVFDDQKTEHRTQMKQTLETRLSQLVKDGKITEDQKVKILAKFSEMEGNRQANMDKMKSMTPEERKTAMKTHKDELQSWAKDNGIDPQYLFVGHKGGMRMGWK